MTSIDLYWPLLTSMIYFREILIGMQKPKKPGKVPCGMDYNSSHLVFPGLQPSQILWITSVSRWIQQQHSCYPYGHAHASLICSHLHCLDQPFCHGNHSLCPFDYFEYLDFSKIVDHETWKKEWKWSEAFFILRQTLLFCGGCVCFESFYQVDT